MNAPAAVPPHPDPTRLRAPWLIAALVIGCALRAALIVLKGPHSFFSDTAEYDAAARSLLAGHGWGAALPRAPAYPALLAFAYRVAGIGNFAAVRWIQLPIGLLAIPLVAWLGARMRAARAGELAAFGVALAPTQVYVSTMLYPSALYTTLLLLATLLAHVLRRRLAAGAALALGIVLGLLWLTDPIATVPALALLAWVGAGAGPLRRRAGVVLLGLATALAVVVPWLAHAGTRPGGTGFVAKAQYVVWVARHEPGLVGGHQVQDPADSVFRARSAPAFVRHELSLVRAQPGAWLHDWGFEFVHFFAPVPDRIQTSNVYTGRLARVAVAAYFTLVLVAALIGLWRSRMARADRVLLALLPLATAATYAFFFTQMRYRVPVEPSLVLLAALAFAPPPPARPATDG